jgi:hypothetical protein
VIEVARRVISESLWATRIAAGSDLGPTAIFHVMVQRCAMSDGSTTDPTLVVLGTEKTAWNGWSSCSRRLKPRGTGCRRALSASSTAVYA